MDPLAASQPNPPSRTRRRVTSCIALALSPILGGAIGLLLAFLFLSGWFVPWQTVSPPPEKPARILAFRGESLWVQTASGAIYQNLSSRSCQGGCWQPVAALPETLPNDPQTLIVKPQSCKPVPPLLGAREVVSECQTAQWWDLNAAYALRAGGSLSTWHYTSGGEYEPLGYPLFAGAGAILFFLIALVVAIVNGLKKA
jgi:hypothetical protein